MRALADLVRAGKLRHYGLSNHSSWRVAEMCRLSDLAGIDRPVVSQPLYNALNRMVEAEHLPACAHLEVAVFPYSPLARGVLTGKYAPGEQPDPGSRAGRQDKRILETEWREESLQIAQELAARAAEHKVTPGQFALAWVLNNRLVTGAIAGPRTLAQWEDYVGALGVRLTPRTRRWWIGWCRPVVPRRRAGRTRHIRWRGGWRADSAPWPGTFSGAGRLRDGGGFAHPERLVPRLVEAGHHEQQEHRGDEDRAAADGERQLEVAGERDQRRR